MRSLTTGSRLVTVFCALVIAAAAAAQTTPPTFQISEVFSNLDGSIQFVRLTETAGLDDQNHFEGLTLSFIKDGVARHFTFPRDLPTTSTAHLSVVVGIGPVIDPGTGPVATIFQFTSCCIAEAHPDFVFAPRFLSTDGGTVDFAGVDQVTFTNLPVDGATALYRDGSTGVAQLPRASCPESPFACPSDLHPTPTMVTAVEFYNAARDHYFVTASAPDIEALDSGRFAGWARTGESFSVGAIALTRLGLEYQYGGLPVCRFYIPPAEGDSHFLSASKDECEAVAARFPSFVLESGAAFYAAQPSLETGVCGALSGFIDGDIATLPLYRLWNQRSDTNHRYTTSLDTRAAMVARGWVSEGYGPLGVAMCVL